MSDITNKIISLINEGKTLNEITTTLNITNKQLFNILTMIKSKGYEFNRKYYFNGEIKYTPNYSFIKNDNNDINIITSPEIKNIEAILISDLHIDHKDDRPDLIYEIYNFCIKNDIHIIINCGDIINGIEENNSIKSIHKNVDEQFNHFLKVYPYDKNILNFVILGNHDIKPLIHFGINFENLLNSYRHDIVSLGYGSGKINIKNDSIYVQHPLEHNLKYEKKYPEKFGIILKGHSHFSSISTSDNLTTIHIPSLNNISTNKQISYPSFYRMKLNNFTNGYFTNAAFQHYIFDYNSPILINEFELNNTSYSKPINIKNKINNEEVLTNNILKLTQTQKFNNKYNINNN